MVIFSPSGPETEHLLQVALYVLVCCFDLTKKRVRDFKHDILQVAEIVCLVMV